MFLLYLHSRPKHLPHCCRVWKDKNGSTRFKFQDWISLRPLPSLIDSKSHGSDHFSAWKLLLLCWTQSPFSFSPKSCMTLGSTNIWMSLCSLCAMLIPYYRVPCETHSAKPFCSGYLSVCSQTSQHVLFTECFLFFGPILCKTLEMVAMWFKPQQICSSLWNIQTVQPIWHQQPSPFHPLSSPFWCLPCMSASRLCHSHAWMKQAAAMSLADQLFVVIKTIKVWEVFTRGSKVLSKPLG